MFSVIFINKHAVVEMCNTFIIIVVLIILSIWRSDNVFHKERIRR